MAAGKVAQACPKFAAAAQLSETAGVRLNLADCYAKLGRTASAWAKADEALTFAERAGDSAAAGLARDQMASLKPSLSYPTITVSRESPPQALEVALDGQKIPDAVWGTPFPVDPGVHEVTASAPRRKPWSTKTTVMEAGARSSVSVPTLEAERTEEASPPHAALQASTPRASSDAVSGGGWSRGTAHVLALVSGGAGLAALAVGVGFGVDAIAKKSEYQQHQVNGRCIDEQCVSFSTEAVNAASVSTIGVVVGGLLAAGGAVLWLTAPGRDSEGRTAAIVPLVGPQGVGAGLTGSW
jgi:hypothetical protein